jgi:flagellum-specific peptidoglycan hydrolase FlgJ
VKTLGASTRQKTGWRRLFVSAATALVAAATLIPASAFAATGPNMPIDREMQQRNIDATTSGDVHAAGYQEDFINSLVEGARRVMADYRVPASVAIGQASLESGYGTSRLGAQDKNYFGIKCNGQHPGPVAIGCRAWETTECTPDCHTVIAYFRIYRAREDSLRDYAILLTSLSRYAPAFNHVNDPDRFIREIQNGGYATDPRYADKVIEIMRRHNLYQYNTPLSTRYVPESSDGVPSMVNTGNGIVMFATRPDGVLMHRWQSGDGGAWSDWVQLGGNLAGRAVALVGRNGKLVVFAREKDTGRLMHTWQHDNGAWNSSWVPLGDRRFSTDPSVVRNPATGLLAVFARDVDGKLLHTWQNSNGAWAADWVDFGAELGTVNGRPVALSGGNGNLVVFVRDRFDNLVHTWQDGNGAWNSHWIGLNRKLSADPSVVLNPKTRDLVVFGRDEQGQLIHAWQSGGAWAPDWVGLGLAVNGRPTVLVRQDTGRLVVITRDSNDNITHTWQHENGAWNSAFIGLHHHADEDVSATFGPNHRIAVFARNPASNTIVHTWQKPDGSWNSGWITMSDFAITG